MEDRRTSLAATSQNLPKANSVRVVHAQVENVVRSAEFVMDVPHFHEYLMATSFENDDDNIEVSSDFNADGILGKITLGVVNGYCDATYVEFEVSVGMDQVGFVVFHYEAKVFLCKDQDQILLHSDQKVTRGDRQQSAKRKLRIGSEEILQEAKRLGKGPTFHVVLNVEAKIFKRPTPHHIVGSCGVDEHRDPPFLKSLQARDDSDVDLIIEDEALPAHAFILKNVSRVFRRKLDVSMSQAGTKKIVMEDLRIDTLKRMLDYIYYGRINVESNAQIMDLLEAAEKYEFDGLKSACLERMTAAMSDENITQFLQISVRVAARGECIKQMVAYCLKRMEELRQRKDFQAFALENPKLFLAN